MKNKSWLGSLISTIIGNLKLSISNIHIRYEDIERCANKSELFKISFLFKFLFPIGTLHVLFSSNPGHPFAAGVTLEKLLAVTIDDDGKEAFATGGALDRIQKVPSFVHYRISIDVKSNQVASLS